MSGTRSPAHRPHRLIFPILANLKSRSAIWKKSLALIEEQAAGLAHLVAFGGEDSIALALLRPLK